MVSTIPELGLLSIKQWKACMPVSFSSQFIFRIALLTFARLTFTLLSHSHCWHFYIWLSTGVIRTFVFQTLVAQAVSFLRCPIMASYCDAGWQKLACGTSTSKTSPRKGRRQSQHKIVRPQQCCRFTFGDHHHGSAGLPDNTCGQMSQTAVQATGRRSCLLDDVRERNDVWAFVEEEAS